MSLMDRLDLAGLSEETPGQANSRLPEERWTERPREEEARAPGGSRELRRRGLRERRTVVHLILGDRRTPRGRAERRRLKHRRRTWEERKGNLPESIGRGSDEEGGTQRLSLVYTHLECWTDAIVILRAF
eukprot:755239-Hanusia_phi.AAC.1